MIDMALEGEPFGLMLLFRNKSVSVTKVIAERGVERKPKQRVLRLAD